MTGNTAIQEVIDQAGWLLRSRQPLDHLGDVNGVRDPENGLVLFSYSRECQFKRPEEWTLFERASRGLIFDERTGLVVARPFAKFWNSGEVEPPNAAIDSVTTKMDGSLGIVFWWDGSWRVATRGSFHSEQAVWARNYIARYPNNFKGLPRHLTFLFEIIYPSNRIVIDYGALEDMVLLAAIDPRRGAEVNYNSLKMIASLQGLTCVDNVAASSLAEVERLVATLGPNEEGFVVRYADGTRLKLKGAEYVRIHRFIEHFSLKSVAEAMIAGTLDDITAACPVSMQAELSQMVFQVRNAILETTLHVEQAFASCVDSISEDVNTREGRKQFAALVMGRYKNLSSYLFAMLDNRFDQASLIRAEFLS